MSVIVAHALAKVNLTINITGKTNNGYHKMQSVFAFLKDVYDELIFYPDYSEKEFCEKSVAIPGIENNSILKAQTILQNNFNLKIPYVEIKKYIPICAGLGGGSSDAACFVNMVFDFWGFSQNKKMSYIDLFRPLGADAKVFLFKYFTNCRFVYINGTGLDGIISNIELSHTNKYILIINDGTQLSTKKVFENFKEPFCAEINDIEHLLKNHHNSLQSSALELAPNLKQILNTLAKLSPDFYGISGSGATCFAVLNNKLSQFETIPYSYIALSAY